MRPHHFLPTMLAAMTTAASASVTVTTSYNDWQAAAGSRITQLTFQGIDPSGSGFHEQYASFGVTDPEPNDIILLTAGRWTLQSLPWSPPTVTFVFSTAISAVGWTSIASLQTADLFLGGTLVASAVPMPGGAGWPFAGLVSDQSFDKVVMTHQALGGVGILDDLWFPTIPAPPAMAVGVIAALASRRRRG